MCAWFNGDSEGTTGLLNTTSVNVFDLFDILRPKVAYESEVITALCNICHFLMSESRLLIHKTRFVRLTLFFAFLYIGGLTHLSEAFFDSSINRYQFTQCCTQFKSFASKTFSAKYVRII